MERLISGGRWGRHEALKSMHFSNAVLLCKSVRSRITGMIVGH